MHEGVKCKGVLLVLYNRRGNQNRTRYLAYGGIVRGEISKFFFMIDMKCGGTKRKALCSKELGSKLEEL
jgi:hypothetical protein